MLAKAPPQGSGASLVVAHGTLGKALLSAALGLPAQAFRRFSFANGAVAEVSWEAASEADMADSATKWRWLYPDKGPWTAAEEERVASSAETPVDTATNIS